MCDHDRMVKDNDECNISLCRNTNVNIQKLVSFLLLAEKRRNDTLREVPTEQPFRGPKIYTRGDYHYHCKVDGGFV